MNVLLVHNFYQQPGGEDQVFADEAAMLAANGHNVGRFTMKNDVIDGMGRIELARKTIWNRDAQVSLRQAIRDIAAQVVHFHNTFPLISPAAYYTAHEEGVATVQTLHNYRLLCPAATFYRAGGVCEKCLGKAISYPAIVHKCYRDNRMASAAVTTMLAYHHFKHTWRDEVDLFIALTEFARRKFAEGGLPIDKILVKPNFVDPDPGIGDGAGGFALFVGRLTEEKGIRILLDAWKPLYAKSGMVLRVVGDGPLRAEVEAAARLQNGIVYLGRQTQAAVYDIMGAAAVLIFPSIWFEGQPKTIVESLAKGTPVIASRLGSMQEMIDHGRTGRLFAPGEPDDLARQVEAFMNDAAGRREMRRAARLEFESRYTAAQNHSALIDCYQCAMDRMNRRPGQKAAPG